MESKQEKLSAKIYRERAAEMLKLAQEAHSSDVKSSYLHLAASWEALARKGEDNPQ